MKDCLFCKIIKKEIPSKLVYEDSHVYAFDDINPQAPVHVLIVPKSHYASLNAVPDERIEEVKHLFLAAIKIAKIKDISIRGYRTVFNCNQDACMSVNHLHLHLLGGTQMGGNMVGL